MNMNITNMTNINNNENILIQNSHTRSSQSEQMLCPGCGRMLFGQNKTCMQAMNQNCENANININQTQNIQRSQNEQNVAFQQEECICPDCRKCPGCGNIQTMNQIRNIQRSEAEQNVQVEENEQQDIVQQNECICPGCKQTKVKAA